MSRWRPPREISVKAIGLLWRAGRLLAAGVRDDAGQLTGVRPLGGSVAFGETAEEAVVREFREELGLAVTPSGPPMILQNIFAHEGAPGHEIVFVFSLSYAESDLLSAAGLAFVEDDGPAVVADWYDLEDLDRPGGIPLFPAGLMGLLPGTM
ncbi:NUDIX hydrolase [Aestuariivirga sp.]|uniref:NUDIX hydrolase n=1 Tax=Aestuariivirga sp. TaxID=2650926 RepID=UPI003BAA46F0